MKATVSDTRANARFAGFPAEAFEFFEQLAKHNERAWLQEQKERYERACREPMLQLITELGGDVTKSHVTRLNRDTRFSRNKAPYRTYIAAGVKGNYISLSATGLFVGTGFYKPEAAVLGRFRDAVDDKASGLRLERIVDSLRARGYDVDTHERLKSAPRGYAADHPRIELLRMKDLYGGKTFQREPWLSTRKALQRIQKTIDDISPLADWVHAYVEPLR
ncbi:MAG TPA: DUF2461 domain-containing protein [Gemmatimonadaceae bacterium]|nr:DUF2461 domain-containing protein [Gemmatimonadaceae bacterium]